MKPNVLIIEDESIFAHNIRTYLSRHGYNARVAETAERGLDEFARFKPVLTLLDYKLGDDDGLEVLSAIHRSDKNANIVLMTGHGNVDIAVKAMKAGAKDFLTKPVPLERIRRLVERITAGSSRALPTKLVRGSPSDVGSLVGTSPAMIQLNERITQIVSSSTALMSDRPPSVLITGETGTGKELVAKALHTGGPRCKGPFISVNCAAIPAHLVESELFGFERGAFTDARTEKPGLIEAANGGVLFLDEIGDLDLSVQSKLLRVLEERKVRRIGSLTDRQLDVWVVSATNRSLEQLVREGTFRSDLLFRLKVLLVETPALRDRDKDILLLTDHLLGQIQANWGGRRLKLTTEARERLTNYSWPGNVRELRNVIEQATLLTMGDLVDVNQLALDMPLGSEATTGGDQFFELPADGVDLELVERDFLVQALDRTGWNITSAADQLGLTRDTMRYRMEKYGLQRPN